MARPKESEREAVRSETRERLLQAATEAFARQGYNRANVDGISRAAGFGKGTIYNYFPSKRDLMLALIDEIAQMHLDFVVARVEEAARPGQRLRRFFEAGFDFVVRHLPAAQVMVNNLYGPDDEFKAAMYAAYLPMFQFVGQEIVGAGMAEGIFRTVDAEATAALVMNIYLGAASQVGPEGRPWLDAGDVADFCWHALRRPGVGR
jgi:AcrR family transcriptional regulator